MRFLHAAIVPSVIFILNKVLSFFAQVTKISIDLVHLKQGFIFLPRVTKISMDHVHPQQGDPTERNSASLLQQDQPSEQHGAQVVIRNQS